MIELMKLPYEHDALEPVISKNTVEFHHDKHHQNYVDTLNKLIEGTELASLTIEEIIKNLDKAPADKKQAIINNAGGVYNHNLYWEELIPGGASEPTGALKEAIDKAFDSFEKFKEEFEAAGKGRFGSGWAWLVKDGDEVKIVSTANQDSPLSEGLIPLLANDVWEHAYYLDYQNARAKYLSEFWKIVNWDKVAERF
ncbi:MAG: superoxide dismutase [Ezakiella sp.]|nr:superoxide dismutase [Bacillota bacterium]MDY3947364.1 superoxide dismutase [Ezakiella sp.]